MNRECVNTLVDPYLTQWDIYNKEMALYGEATLPLSLQHIIGDTTCWKKQNEAVLKHYSREKCGDHEIEIGSHVYRLIDLYEINDNPIYLSPSETFNAMISFQDRIIRNLDILNRSFAFKYDVPLHRLNIQLMINIVALHHTDFLEHLDDCMTLLGFMYDYNK